MAEVHEGGGCRGARLHREDGCEARCSHEGDEGNEGDEGDEGRHEGHEMSGGSGDRFHRKRHEKAIGSRA